MLWKADKYENGEQQVKLISIVITIFASSWLPIQVHFSHPMKLVYYSMYTYKFLLSHNLLYIWEKFLMFTAWNNDKDTHKDKYKDNDKERRKGSCRYAYKY